jgi:hypothetical protein
MKMAYEKKRADGSRFFLDKELLCLNQSQTTQKPTRVYSIKIAYEKKRATGSRFFLDKQVLCFNQSQTTLKKPTRFYSMKMA